MLRLATRRVGVPLLSFAHLTVCAGLLVGPAVRQQVCLFPRAAYQRAQVCSAALPPDQAGPDAPPPPASTSGVTMPTERQPGEWESPITSELITSAVSGGNWLWEASGQYDGWTAVQLCCATSSVARAHRQRRPQPCMQTKRLGAVSFTSGGDLIWLEGRPAEKGRQVLVRK